MSNNKLKSKKSVLVIICGLLICGLLFSIVRMSKIDRVMKIATVKKSYNFLSLVDETDKLIIPIYININSSFISKKENIKKSFIVDEDENNVIKIDLTELERTSHTANIDDENYYCYLYSFDIDKTDNIVINDAYLRLDSNETIIKMSIGSITINKTSTFDNSNNLISITNLKGIINTLDNEKTKGSKREVVGIALGLKNNYNESIEIKSITPLDCNYNPAFSEIIYLESLPNSNERINNILGYEYDYYHYNQNTSEEKVVISGKERINLLLPLKKIGPYSSNCFGLLVEFVNNRTKEEYKIYIDDFLFYTSKSENEEYEVLIYENY